MAMVGLMRGWNAGSMRRIEWGAGEHPFLLSLITNIGCLERLENEGKHGGLERCVTFPANDED